MNERPVRIAGTGGYLPGEPVKFFEIESVLGELTDVRPEFMKWYKLTQAVMYQLLGMEYYHYAIDRETGECNETCAGMAAKAAREALRTAGLQPEDIDLLIYAGSSNDRFICPPTSALVQQELGIECCAEMSIHSNCTATYKGLQIASDLIANGRYDRALLVSSNLVSSALRSDFFNQPKLKKNQAILRWFLSDGAGAVVLVADPERQAGLYIQDTYVDSVGAKYPSHMYTSMGASSYGPRRDYEEGNHHISQDYRDVSQLGPKVFIEGLVRFCEQMKRKVGLEEYKRRILSAKKFLVNVPTRHLIDLTADELKVTFRKKFQELRDADYDMYYSTIDRQGYTGPAAILLTLHRLLTHETLEPSETVISFVTESSKWMNAGFLLEWLDK